MGTIGNQPATSASRYSPRKSVCGWALWSVPRRARTNIVGVEILVGALVVFVVTDTQFDTGYAVRAGLLVTLGILYAETANRVDLLRRYLHLSTERKVWSNPTSVWTFAASLLLPFGYAAAVVAVVYGHIYLHARRHRLSRSYQIVFGCTTTLLGAGAAIGTQGLVGARLESGGPAAAAVVLMSLVAYTITSLAATTTAVHLIRAPSTFRAVLPDFDAIGFEIATLMLGMVTAACLLFNPWLIPAVFVLIAVLHRSTLVKDLEVAASTDTKTGLLTAGAWHDMAGRHLARASRAGEPAALLMIDLDHFKRVNDEFGHLAGDQMLRSVANCLKTELRGYDALGRFGGEEFVAVLDGVGKDAAVSIAVRLAEAISALKSAAAGEHDLPSRLTASIGVASFPADGTSVDALTAAADTALYEAKGDGRNCVRHIEEIAPVS